MKKERGLVTAAAILGAVAALLWLERHRPQRPAADPGAGRIVTNVGVAAVTAVTATTALRFHFAEFVASIPWRCAQIGLIGVSPRALSLWQRLTTLEVVFHHSNLRLPLAVERALARLVVTPRMHGIHHSMVCDERDSNFSTGLAVWDRLHGTGRFDLSRQPIIGVPGHGDAESVSLPETLALPFRSAATDRPGE